MNDDTKKLGLPLEYQHMPEYFDAHNLNEDTEAKNALIARLLKKHHVKTVFDMTCGTGSQVFYLQQCGYDVVGSDFSSALLDQARNKAITQGKQTTFIDGDMRMLQAGQFDAVITIFNAIGHLSQPDFEKALQNIHSNLKEHGFYVFDIFNLTAITDNIIQHFDMDSERVVDGMTIRHQQHSEIDQKNSLLTSHDRYFITKNDREPEIHTNTFSLRIYTAEVLQELLERNGFDIVHQYDMEGNDFVPETSINMLTVARKRA